MSAKVQNQIEYPISRNISYWILITYIIIVQTKRDTSADLSEAKNQEIHSWLECLLWISLFYIKV